jgi:hypothetical protein
MKENRDVSERRKLRERESDRDRDIGAGKTT